jgi:hypothetical protein
MRIKMPISNQQYPSAIANGQPNYICKLQCTVPAINVITFQYNRLFKKLNVAIKLALLVSLLVLLLLQSTYEAKMVSKPSLIVSINNPNKVNREVQYCTKHCAVMSKARIHIGLNLSSILLVCRTKNSLQKPAEMLWYSGQHGIGVQYNGMGVVKYSTVQVTANSTDNYGSKIHLGLRPPPGQELCRTDHSLHKPAQMLWCSGQLCNTVEYSILRRVLVQASTVSYGTVHVKVKGTDNYGSKIHLGLNPSPGQGLCRMYHSLQKPAQVTWYSGQHCNEVEYINVSIVPAQSTCCSTRVLQTRLKLESNCPCTYILRPKIQDHKPYNCECYSHYTLITDTSNSVYYLINTLQCVQIPCSISSGCGSLLVHGNYSCDYFSVNSIINVSCNTYDVGKSQCGGVYVKVMVEILQISYKNGVYQSLYLTPCMKSGYLFTYLFYHTINVELNCCQNMCEQQNMCIVQGTYSKYSTYNSKVYCKIQVYNSNDTSNTSIVRKSGINMVQYSLTPSTAVEVGRMKNSLLNPRLLLSNGGQQCNAVIERNDTWYLVQYSNYNIQVMTRVKVGNCDSNEIQLGLNPSPGKLVSRMDNSLPKPSLVLWCCGQLSNEVEYNTVSIVELSKVMCNIMYSTRKQVCGSCRPTKGKWCVVCNRNSGVTHSHTLNQVCPTNRSQAIVQVLMYKIMSNPKYQVVRCICNVLCNEVSNRSVKITNGNINNKKSRTLKLIQWNKGSSYLTGSLEEVEILMQNEKPDMLALSESMILEKDTIEEVCIPGYCLEQADTFRDLNISRSCMYIKSTVQYIRRHDLEESPISTVWVELIVPGTSNVLVMGGYRQWRLPGNYGGNSESSPSQQARWVKLCQQWNRAISEDKEVLVLMDDNIDSTDWTTDYANVMGQPSRLRTRPMYYELVDKIFSKGVVVLNDKITRQIKTGHPSILDHIYTTHPLKVAEVFTRTHGKSDHRMVGIIWSSTKPIQALGYMKCRNESKVTGQLLKQYINERGLVDRVLVEGNVDTAACLFMSEMEVILEQIAPLKVIQLQKNYSPYIGDEEKEAIKQRADAYDKALINNNVESWREYRNLKNTTTNKIKNAKRKWLTKRLNNINNAGDVWKTAKTFWKYNEEGPPKGLIINGKFSNKPKEMVVELNKKYIKKVNDFRSHLDKIDKKDPIEILRKIIPRIQSEFIIKEITSEQTINLIRSFKTSNSRGPDSLTISHIKKAGEVLIPIIKHIINLSIKQSKVPQVLKNSRITPLKKKGKDELQPLSYRPINNISTMAKLGDRHIFSQLAMYMETNNILHENHHGGRAGHSTETALLEIHNNLYEIIDQGRIAALISIDLSAAFDLCDHKIMVDKLEHYGIRNRSLEWFRSYLSDRTQCVQIGAETSPNMECPPCSVIQGSVGSGLLYTIYTNEMPLIVPYYLPKQQKFLAIRHEEKPDVSTRNFVDDSNTVVMVQNICNVSTVMECSYLCLSTYLRANLMIINGDKTAAIIAARQHRDQLVENITFLADNYIIKPLHNIKTLGYHLSSNLNHNVHIIHHRDSVFKKLIYRLNVIKRLARYTDFKNRKMIANAIFNGTLCYLLSLWGTSDIKVISKIQVLQLNAARAVIGHRCIKWTRYKILSTLNWLSVDQMVLHRLATIIHNAIMFKLPVSLANKLEIIKIDQRTRTRAMVRFKTTLISRMSGLARDQPLNRAIRFYNTIPVHIIQLGKDQFKMQLKIYIKINIPIIRHPNSVENPTN